MHPTGFLRNWDFARARHACTPCHHCCGNSAGTLLARIHRHRGLRPGISVLLSTRPASVICADEMHSQVEASSRLYLAREHFPPAHPPTSTPGVEANAIRCPRLCGQRQAAPPFAATSLNLGKRRATRRALAGTRRSFVYVRRAAPAVPAGFSIRILSCVAARVARSGALVASQPPRPGDLSPWLLLLLCSPRLVERGAGRNRHDVSGGHVSETCAAWLSLLLVFLGFRG